MAPNHDMNGTEVKIRPPLPFRLYTYGFGVLWCVVGVDVFAHAFPKSSSIVPALILASGATFLWRVWALLAKSDGDELLVRNLYRTRRVPASQITQFRTGPAPWLPFGRTVLVVTDSDAFSLDACGMWNFRTRSERDKEGLDSWLGTTRG